MRATFAAARRRYPGRRLWAVYEPLTYHRTAAMLDAFADVLAEADRAAVIDIWAVRDPDRTITSAAALADAVTERSSVAGARDRQPRGGRGLAGRPRRARRRRPGDGRRPLVRRRRRARAAPARARGRDRLVVVPFDAGDHRRGLDVRRRRRERGVVRRLAAGGARRAARPCPPARRPAGRTARGPRR